MTEAQATEDILRKATQQGETPAFPIVSDQFGHFSGMTLRDWLAAQALISMGQWVPSDCRGRFPEDIHSAKAKWAYEMADAMLIARAALSSAGNDGAGE